MITIVSLVTWDDKLLTRTFKTCFCGSLEGCKAVWLNVISILGVTFLCPACFRTGSFIPPWGRIIFCCVAGPRFCLSARQLMDTWVVLTLWLLWTVLWTWVCKYLFVTPLSIILGIYIWRNGMAESHEWNTFHETTLFCKILQCVLSSSEYRLIT